MKLFSAEQIKSIDQCTIAQQNISSWELMERAASELYYQLIFDIYSEEIIHIYCGKGNNGGDGLALSRMLLNSNSNIQVKTFIVQHTQNASQDFLINYEKLKQSEQNKNISVIQEITGKEDIEKIQVFENTVCIDAILGSGVNKPTSGIIKTTIDFINSKYSKILSIDVPSGLFLDNANSIDDSIIRAHKTYTFQFPKKSFFFLENADFLGDWEIVDIGLSEKCINEQQTNFYTIDEELVKSLYIPRKKISAKWDYGHCLIIAGSANMQGAAIMNVGAALRSGCGLVSMHSVSNVLNTVIHHYPECILSKDEQQEYISDIPDISRYSAICFGSGIGVNNITQKAFEKLLSKISNQKLIIDADGLNLIKNHFNILESLNDKQIIITPHIKEFDRIFGVQKNHYDRIQKGIEIAKTRKIVIVLKSAYTSVILPSGDVYFNTYANSGLAKGGSGDILAGLIAGLCARGYSIENASIMGVYIHSLAGKLSVQNIHPECVLPTNILNYFSEAFKHISNE